MAVYCPKCGAENRATAKFCMQCSASMTTSLPQDRVCTSCGTRNPEAAKYCLNCATPLHASTPPAGLTGLLAPDFLLNSRYTIVKRLGKGGMGAVYQANDTRIGGKVWAIKEMSDAAILNPAEKQQAREAFQREAQMLALLDHPNLPKVNDFFTEGGKLYLVMDYVDGQTLEALLEASSGPLPEARVLDWAGQLCDVLNYLHHCTPPIIFRDLKPGNIMLDKSGRVKLIDFGVARLFKAGKQHDTESFGTAGYAPPEQYGKGQTDARSDVYALGVTLHQLLTQYDPTLTPFNLPPARNVNPAVSVHVEQALIKATQSAQANRHQNALEFKTALLTRPPVKATVAAATSPVFQMHPTPQPVTVNPAVASPPIVVPRVVAPKSTQMVTVHRASNKALVFTTLTVGVILAFIYNFFGEQIVNENLSNGSWVISGLALSTLFFAGPLAYALFRRPGSFLLAWVAEWWVLLILWSGGVTFGDILRNPNFYLVPIVFELVAASRRQKVETYRAMILVMLLAVMSARLAGGVFFGWGQETNTLLMVAEADYRSRSGEQLAWPCVAEALRVGVERQNKHQQILENEYANLLSKVRRRKS